MSGFEMARLMDRIRERNVRILSLQSKIYGLQQELERALQEDRDTLHLKAVIADFETMLHVLQFDHRQDVRVLNREEP